MTTDSLSPQDALVAVMIAVSAADERASDAEMQRIMSTVVLLPAFRGYDLDRVNYVSSLVGDLFEDDDGIDALVGLVDQALPEHLHETAYALACDVAAADGKVAMTELRLLEILRHDLKVDRLTSAAIERGARARHQPLEPR